MIIPLVGVSLLRNPGTDIHEFPELGIFLQCLVFTQRQAGAKQEILQCVLVQNSVNDDSQLAALKINTVISQTVAI